MIRKPSERSNITFCFRSIEDSAGKKYVIASSDIEDRYGDIIDQDTINLKWYTGNPVILYAHDSRGVVIGKATDIAVRSFPETGERRFLSFIPVWDDKADNPPNDLARLVSRQWDDFIRTVSIGCFPKKYTLRSQLPKDHKYYSERQYAYLLQDCELVEISVTPTPANPEAAQKSLSEGDSAFSDSGKALIKALIGEVLSEREKDCRKEEDFISWLVSS